jgi:hypothetical protein
MVRPCKALFFCPEFWHAGRWPITCYSQNLLFAKRKEWGTLRLPAYQAGADCAAFQAENNRSADAMIPSCRERQPSRSRALLEEL